MTKPKNKNMFLKFSLLLLLCFSLFFNNKGTVDVCHALASWNPITGFQPGISVDIGDGMPATPSLPNTNYSDIIYTNSDGSLRAFTSLKVKNDKINTSYGGWKHAAFVEYFSIKRTDGRLIYDDDG